MSKNQVTSEQNSLPTNIAALPTKSAKIRALNKAGRTRSEIAKILGIRYQHVRNVLIQPLKSDKTTD